MLKTLPDGKFKSHLLCKLLIKLMKENCQLKLKEKRNDDDENVDDEKHHTKYSKGKKKQRNKATYKSFRSQLKVLLRFPNVLFKCIKLNGNFEHG